MKWTLSLTLNPSYEALAQLAHIGWAGMLTFIIALWLPLWAALLIVIAAGAVKEFVVEVRIEPVQTQGSAWRDFAYWCLGAATAFLTIAARILF